MKWASIAENLPGRIGEQVRDRYVNYLDPNLKRTPWTAEENNILLVEQRRVGNRWAEIAKHLPGRSENSVKNRWHNAKMTQRRQMRSQAVARKNESHGIRASGHDPTKKMVKGPMIEEYPRVAIAINLLSADPPTPTWDGHVWIKTNGDPNPDSDPTSNSLLVEV
jgi:hypothetical protein